LNNQPSWIDDKVNVYNFGKESKTIRTKFCFIPSSGSDDFQNFQFFSQSEAILDVGQGSQTHFRKRTIKVMGKSPLKLVSF
jgi:hypothetical protein